MKKNLFLISLIFGYTFLTQLEASANNFSSFKKVYEEINQIGEVKYNKEESSFKYELLGRITNLLSWKTQGTERVELSSGVFTMLAPKKEKLTNEFEIKNYKNHFSGDSYGSAFLYKEFIVTNYHMCRGLDTIIRDYKNDIYSVKVLAYNVKQDICILKAPEAVMDQRNFATFNAELDEKEEMSIKEKIYSGLNKNKSGIMSFKEKRELLNLMKNIKEEKRDYAKIYGAYGEFFIYNIEKDNAVDNWSKDFAYTAYGSKCKSGVSGSPVVSNKGIIGLFWGAEETSALAKRIASIDKRSPAFTHESMPSCYFVDIKEVDKVIKDYTDSVKK